MRLGWRRRRGHGEVEDEGRPARRLCPPVRRKKIKTVLMGLGPLDVTLSGAYDALTRSVYRSTRTPPTLAIHPSIVVVIAIIPSSF
jgi:hypothetical protein